MSDIKNPAILTGLPNLEEYYMMMAFVAASRANCLNRYVGCIVVTGDNRSILSSGYNGAPSGLPHCETCRRRNEGYGPGEGLHRSRSSHAEQNALIQAAKYGKEVNNSILYCTTLPCNECCKIIINAGVSKVVFCDDYPNSEALEMLKLSNIDTLKLDRKIILEKLQNWVDSINPVVDGNK